MWVVLLGWIAVGVCAFLAYCPMAHKLEGENPEDGLGRPLRDAPSSARVLLFGGTKWAGADWMIADGCVLLGWTVVTLLARSRPARSA